MVAVSSCVERGSNSDGEGGRCVTHDFDATFFNAVDQCVLAAGLAVLLARPEIHILAERDQRIRTLPAVLIVKRLRTMPDL